MSDAPRITPEEADARFAALVAEHRNGKNRGEARPSAGPSPDTRTAVAFVLVYCFGVAAGVFWHGAPLVAVLVGAPALFFFRILRRRRGSGTS